MRSKSYVINQRPIPWQRARLNGKRFFDNQMREKNYIGVSLLQQHGQEPFFSGPTHLDITFFMAAPKSKDNAMEPHTKRPDLDNLIKFLLDTMNMIVYEDDAIIYSISARKVWDIRPRTEFTLTEL